uniref:hypothetical protein n=1 Tax=Candidatus Cryptobacteroides bacterium TaxID=3085639 RepID=UPI0040269FF9
MRTLIITMLLFVSLTTASAQSYSKGTESTKPHGLEMAETLSDDGMEIVRRPFKWFAGIGESDDRQIAIEIAQREAQSAVSRIIRNEVIDQATKIGVAANGRVCQALVTSWEQYSHSILVGCEPFGNAKVQYNPNTGTYRVIARIGIQGDRFKKMMNEYQECPSEELTPVENQQYVQISKAVVNVMISE